MPGRRRNHKSLYLDIPEQLHPYAILFVVLTAVVIFSGYLYFARKKMRVAGDIRLEEGRLYFGAYCKGRTTNFEIQWSEITVIANDETELSISTPCGEFSFLPRGFYPQTRYNDFCREFQEKRYEK